mmetsp:Transcript_37654/g.110293  ORF Transcript_37654/g.110293 Transcript_37654/m.110293 type:complete len:219 (-) Transcript_37654:476-1132(-)
MRCERSHLIAVSEPADSGRGGGDDAGDARACMTPCPLRNAMLASSMQLAAVHQRVPEPRHERRPPACAKGRAAHGGQRRRLGGAADARLQGLRGASEGARGRVLRRHRAGHEAQTRGVERRGQQLLCARAATRRGLVHRSCDRDRDDGERNGERRGAGHRGRGRSGYHRAHVGRRGTCSPEDCCCRCSCGCGWRSACCSRSAWCSRCACCSRSACCRR